MRRRSIVVTYRLPVDGGTPPNTYKPEVTVEVRVAWPPATPQHVMTDAVMEAAERALHQLGCP